MLCANFLIGQISINEYSASNLHGFYDSYGKSEDWIELYNASSKDVDISGYHLSDKESNPAKWKIPFGTVIPAESYLLFYCSGRDLVKNGEYHTNFKLTQTKSNEFIILSDANENIIEALDLPISLVEHSRCKESDGSLEWKVCINPSPGATNTNTAQYNGYTIAPSMNLEAGFYKGSQTVALMNLEPNSTLRYTLDGTKPTQSSQEYTNPLEITETTIVKALSFSADPSILPGKIVFNTYFIDVDYSLPVFSVGADELQDLANGAGEIIPVGSLEYFNKDKERAAVGYGDLNRHGQDSWVLDHRSIDWITRDEMGYTSAINAPIFSKKERDQYQRFMFRNSGDDNYPAISGPAHEGSTHIRDEYVQTLAQEGEMKLDYRTVERIVLFLNGDYWGVYGMREKVVDHDYTEEYYDQGKYDLQYLTTWETTEIRYGGERALNEWVALRDFILNNDMGIEENYKIASDSINLTSMIDYMIVNLNVVASDWLNYNTGWWRGLNPDGDHKKWGYMLWDMDATFDYYENYSGVPNTSPDAEPCDLEVIAEFMEDFFWVPQLEDPTNCTTLLNGDCPYPADDPILPLVMWFESECCSESWDDDCDDTYEWVAETFGEDSVFGPIGKHEQLFLKLLEESEDFKKLYYTRYVDLMNSVYSCENMIETLDKMVEVIRPEMPGQIDRWGGSVQQWEDNVDDLKNYINERCEYLDDGMINCYDDLTSSYEVTLLTEPDLVGEIDINSLDIERFPWKGNYFGGMENDIKAKVYEAYDELYVFSHWKSTAGNQISPDINSRKATIRINNPDTLIAVFQSITATSDLFSSKFNVDLFPNPAKEHININFELKQKTQVNFELYSLLGKKLMNFPLNSGVKQVGSNTETLTLDKRLVGSGLYLFKVKFDNEEKSYRINIIE